MRTFITYFRTAVTTVHITADDMVVGPPALTKFTGAVLDIRCFSSDVSSLNPMMQVAAPVS